MQTEDVVAVRGELDAFFRTFDPCMGRPQNRKNARVYVDGLLSDLQRKSVEPIALRADIPPRTLQEFLATSDWDHAGVRDRLQRRVANKHAHEFAIGIIDDTSFAKKGRKTPGVQRQYCGSLGKTENCVVSVHLGYAADDFQVLLDSDVFLPEHTWSDDPARRREAGIPDGVVHRPKWRMALEQYERAIANGVRFRFVTFDEAYSRSREFLRSLDRLGQNWVAEVPADFHVWTREPELLRDGRARGSGPDALPRLKKCNPQLCRADDLFKHSPVVRSYEAEMFRVHEGSKGPTVWEVKHVPAWLADGNGLPGKQHHLFFTRNPLDANEQVKYFVSNAPPDEPLDNLLLAAHGRWRIERLFEDAKDELGLDHFEGRKFSGVSRHLLLTCVSLLFAAEFRGRRAEKKSEDHGEPSAHGDGGPGSHVVGRPPLHDGPRGLDLRENPSHSSPQCDGRGEAPGKDARPPARLEHPTVDVAHLRLAEVAL